MELANHGLILLQQLNAQREFGFLCDCTVAIGDVFFKAHKAVLAAFSNYFRMLFIHQDSDCVRLKAADIQPDIFSYLLNLMYTGKLAPQLIDPSRLEQGVRFLHAYPLLQEASQMYSDHSVNLSTSLYGIQISDQQGGLSSRLSTCRQLSSPFESEQPSSEGKFQPTQAASAAFPTSFQSKFVLSPPEAETSISQTDSVVEEGRTDLINSDASSTILHVKPSIMKRNASFRKHYSCHLCRSRFTQRSLLREHLLQHNQPPHQPSAEVCSAQSPITTAEECNMETEASAKGTNTAAPAAVEIISDSEQMPVSGTNSDSPRAEVSTSSWALGGLASQADTPPPSDIADIDNLESVDIDREVKRRKYECSTCGRKFIQKSHWREHMYIHTGKPFKCSACGKSFCRANQAARHVCLNPGADSYTIVDRQTMELCGGDDPSQMEAMFMAPAKPYKCNICATTFSNATEVIKHLCFTQEGTMEQQEITEGGAELKQEEISKDEGSDVSNTDIPRDPISIKSEEILVE